VNPAAWAVHRRAGSVAEFHVLDLLGSSPVRRGLWIFDAADPAVVFGSAQRDVGGGRASGVPIVRASGGGAVLVDPDRSVWVDVVIPRDDPLWNDDVGRSALWLGRVWQAALAELGVRGEVYRGRADRHPLARAACFAGVGPGEVVVDGRKLVGISQRRTRAGARFQCLAYTSPPDAALVVAALGEHAPEGLESALAAATGWVTATPGVLLGALERAMMWATPTAGDVARAVTHSPPPSGQPDARW